MSCFIGALELPDLYGYISQLVCKSEELRWCSQDYLDLLPGFLKQTLMQNTLAL